MEQKKRVQKDLVALRLPAELRKVIPEGNLSGFIKEAIKEKIDREEGYKVCPKCKGMGKIRSKP